MLNKIKDLLNSLRFWQVTAAAGAAFLSDVAVNGYSTPKLLMFISGWLAAIAGIGTVDKFGKSIGHAKH